MSGILLGGAPSQAPITATPNWGTDTVVHGTAKSSTVTASLAAPAGNPGGIILSFTNTAGGTVQYNLSAGGLTTFTSPTTISMPSSSETLLFRSVGSTSAGTLTVSATDNATGVVIGTWVLTVT